MPTKRFVVTGGPPCSAAPLLPICAESAALRSPKPTGEVMESLAILAASSRAGKTRGYGPKLSPRADLDVQVCAAGQASPRRRAESQRGDWRDAHGHGSADHVYDPWSSKRGSRGSRRGACSAVGGESRSCSDRSPRE